MKKMIWIVLLAVLSYWACNDKENVAPVFSGMEINGEDLLKGDTLLFDTAARTAVLSVVVSGEWTAEVEEDAEWCGAIRSALPGVNKLQINVFANPQPAERSCKVLVKGGNEQRTLVVHQIGSEPALKVAPAQFPGLNYDSTGIKFRVVTNVKYSVEVTEGQEWIIPLEQDEQDMITYSFSVLRNGATPRNGKILVKQTDGELSHEVSVFQQAKESDYVPGDASTMGDLKLTVERATVTGTENGQPINDFWYGQAVIGKSFDGDAGTHYASKAADKFPVTLTYYLTSPSKVDYLTYLPRQDGNVSSGFIGDCAVWYQQDGSEEFTKIGNYNFGAQEGQYRLEFAEALENAAAIRLVVTSSNNGQVSCAEMCFYTKRISAATDLFADQTCSVLKPGITLDQINGLSEEDGFLKKIALHLYDNTYPMERIQMYRPYMTVETLSSLLKTSSYNKVENPTGIYFRANERAVIFMGESSYPISLKVVDWSRDGGEKKSDYVLSPGMNVLDISQDGLGYIIYYTDDYETAPEVKIHIASGIVNGYFDLENNEKNQNSYYRTLLTANRSAECGILDIRGKYVQLAFDKESLLANNPDQGREMIQEYDNIIKMEQDVMGIDAYGLRTGNRMFARRSYSGAPNANGWGVSFPGLNVKPENIRKSSWEIGHEFGHVNQVRPGLKWQGTTEVTNNIYAATVQYFYTPENLRLEQEKIGDGEGGTAMVGNRFNCYFNNGIIKKQPWLFQKGQNNPNPETGAGDLFVRLCPFWQLQLYNKMAGLGVTDFYPQLINKVRETDEKGLTPKELQFNFMRNTCEIMGTDMTDFFEKCGMLRLVDRDVSDYGGAIRLTITQEDIDVFKAEIAAKNYSQPLSPVIYYISGNSVDAFKNKKAVQGVTGEGVSGSGSTRIVLASAWKNVVAFETYAGHELVKLTLPFTNYIDKTATTVFYPDGSTRIEAVAWDGSRTLVYGTR